MQIETPILKKSRLGNYRLETQLWLCGDFIKTHFVHSPHQISLVVSDDPNTESLAIWLGDNNMSCHLCWGWSRKTIYEPMHRAFEEFLAAWRNAGPERVYVTLYEHK